MKETTICMPTDICKQLPVSILAPRINFKMSVDVCHVRHDGLPVWSLCRYHLVHVLPTTMTQCNARAFQTCQTIIGNCISRTTGSNGNIKSKRIIPTASVLHIKYKDTKRSYYYYMKNSNGHFG